MHRMTADTVREARCERLETKLLQLTGMVVIYNAMLLEHAVLRSDILSSGEHVCSHETLSESQMSCTDHRVH